MEESGDLVMNACESADLYAKMEELRMSLPISFRERRFFKHGEIPRRRRIVRRVCLVRNAAQSNNSLDERFGGVTRNIAKFIVRRPG